MFKPGETVYFASRVVPFAELERAYIEYAWKQCGKNKSVCAEMIGLSLRKVRYVLNRKRKKVRRKKCA